jgi:hypothetical protein
MDYKKSTKVIIDGRFKGLNEIMMCGRWVMQRAVNSYNVGSSPTTSAYRVDIGMVDGSPWTGEVGGSNPPTLIFKF